MTSLLTSARETFHDTLIESGVLGLDANGVATNADKDQRTSRQIAADIAEQLGVRPGLRLAGQSSGKLFEDAVRAFLDTTMPLFPMLRPGKWRVENVGGKRRLYHLARYEPYLHLDDLARAIEKDRTLEAALGNAYNVSPDVLVVRAPETDVFINQAETLVDLEHGRKAVIREVNNPAPIVHAVVSCKWTMRSDRSQNSRAEALNIIRNRKGRTPHIAVVAGEPTPSRLSSLALGTGDIDTIYHFAMPELIKAVDASGNDEAQEMLRTLIEGKRLRDISDLPLDLTV